jgi:uncharacterized cupin superfamily protein
VPNVFASDWDVTFGDVGMFSVTKEAGAELLGATVYELGPGARWADLHVHFANEELIVVLAGAPTLVTLDGDRELAPGEVVACLRGHDPESHGRLVRVFERDAGRPVPPDG